MTIETSDYAEYKRPRLMAREGMHGWCGIQDCNNPQLDSLPLCEDHSWDLWMEMGVFRTSLREAGAAKMRYDAWQDSRNEMLRKRYEATRNGTAGSDPGVIYYLQVEDQIKIGFTGSLETRLKAYPPMAKLLAVHPGTRKIETAMHKKFDKHHASRREWFHLNEDLDKHIADVRQRFKQDPRVIA